MAPLPWQQDPRGIDDHLLSNNPSTHLSNHHGYELTDPKKFCKKYGPYLLKVLTCLHIGIVAAGAIVPPLSSLIKITSWITITQSFLNNNTPSFSDPYRNAMDLVANLCKSTVPKVVLEDNRLLYDGISDIPEPLEGYEYQEFTRFLQSVDPNGIYGNMKITFSDHSGELQWVCKDHVGPSAKAKTLWNALESVVLRMAKPGSLDRLKGFLEFTLLDDEKVMDELYQALYLVPGVKKVLVRFGSSYVSEKNAWSKLQKGISGANIPHVTLDGSLLERSISSVSRLIMKIMTNKRCRSMRLVGFKDLFSRMVDNSLDQTCQLTYLDLDLPFTPSRDLSSLKILLALCPALTHLTLKCAYDDDLPDQIREGQKRLQQVTMVDTGFKAVVTLATDDYDKPTHTVEISASVEHDLSPIMSSTGPHLRAVRLDCLPSHSRDSLEDLLRYLDKACDQLDVLDIRVALEEFEMVVESVRGQASSLRRVLRLCSLPTEHKVEMTVVFQLTGLQDIRINSEMTGTQNSNVHLDRIFQVYGSSILKLSTNHLLDDSMLRSLAKSIEDNGSILEDLAIDPCNLSDIASVQTLVDNSTASSEFTLSFSHLQDTSSCAKAIDYIDMFGFRDRPSGRQVSRLILHAEGRNLEWIEAISLHRGRLPGLRHLEIMFGGPRKIHVDTKNAMDSILSLISKTGLPSTSPLQTLKITNCFLSNKQWGYLLDLLDFKSTLQCLDVEDTSFGLQQMDLLRTKLPYPSANRERICNVALASLTDLFIAGTPLLHDKSALDCMETKLLLRVPSLRVIRKSADS
ncbi:hypothetical protein BGZ83_007682 [Gryganskiella cystojenkinii]|nr:hypothetical protein BGZ83_007682 [Gryganskiella cystojenkinii]